MIDQADFARALLDPERLPPAGVQAQLLAAGHDVPMHSIEAWLRYTTRAHLEPERGRSTSYLTTT